MLSSVDEAFGGLLPDNSAQKESRSYLLAVDDTEFLLRDEMRSMRFAMEYGKPDLGLRDWGIRSTVVVFGSARILPAEQAALLVRDAVGKDAVRAAKKHAALACW
jgi:hypothetical protein